MLAQYAIERFPYRLSKSRLADRFVLKGAMLFRVWAAAFRRRSTVVPEHAPTGLSDEFAGDPIAQRRWTEFLHRLRIQDAPEDLGEVVKTVWARVELPTIKADALTLGK